MPDNNGREGVVIEAIKYIIYYYYFFFYKVCLPIYRVADYQT